MSARRSATLPAHEPAILNLMKLIEASIPHYNVDAPPDIHGIGKILDEKLKQNFMGKSVLIRGIASSEHSGKSADDLIEIIERTGTDRYNPARVGDRYENIDGKHIDFFAFSAKVEPETEVMHNIIYGFYHSAIGIHGRPMKIDIITIYDADKMQQVLHQYEGRDDIKDDGFAFKNPADKPGALLGIIKIN